ncbi:armadillo-type protein [Chaetomium strumarium]|uniref:Armadillo-type protein n=1 Tax=Chaetomium strumarium TaxID=1170767 RepID=A0AAJ0GM55_9PEZI|nr:armadillo-type protein [Chaetomium strumarium]
MANTTRPSRLPNYTTMSNNTERPPQLSSGFSMGPYPSNGPWNNSAIGAFARNRDAVAPRGSSARGSLLPSDVRRPDGFTDASNLTGPSGSGALAATSEADPWPGRSDTWNTADNTQSRTLSGNTSPRSRSDASGQDMNTAYYTATSAIGPRGLLGSKPTPSSALDSSSNAFKNVSTFPGYEDDDESFAPFGQFKPADVDRLEKFLAVQRQAQESSMLNAVGSGPSRNSVSSHPESDLHGHTNPYGDYNYGIPGAPGRHSQRPSLAGSSFVSHNTRGFDSNAGRQADEQLAESLARLTMDNGRGAMVDGASNVLSFTNGAQNFEFNPGSQPWGSGQGHGAYTIGTGVEKRGSIVGRSSPSGNAYRVGGALNSPRGLADTADPWSRPGSREVRMGPDLGRRGIGPAFTQQPQMPFFQDAYYTGGYDHYTQIYGQFPAPGSPAHLPGFAMPMAHFALGAGAVPIRPAADQDPGKAFRSVLLDEFHKSSPKSNRRYELRDIIGHITEFSGDQQGSRFIQHKLETANSDEKDQVFREIEPNAIQLMKDLFGNYVIQRFFEHGNQVQKKVLAGAMKGKVVDLSKQAYACRVVQKALEHLLVEQQAELVKELEPEIVNLAKHQQGNHVVQQAIALVPRQHIAFIMDAFTGRICELASHQFGCRVIQRILEHGTEADKAVVTQELHNSAQTLITDSYGNYVVQHVIEKGKAEDRSRIIRLVIPQLLTLSRNKCASNVVEKCIVYGTVEEQRAIRDQLIGGGDDNCPLFQLTKDQYGNYVVQKLVKNLQPQDREVLLDKLRAHLQSLRKAGNTGRQTTAIDRVISEFSVPAGRTRDSTPASTAPTSPGLRVDVNSAAPTPNLTMDSASPLSTPSSCPPCPNGAGAEAAAEHAKTQLCKGGENVTPGQPQISEL